MKRYHSPKDYLDAARDPTTAADELRLLADSDYDFVRLSVAEHPHTEPDVLVALIPQQIESWNEQQRAYALARHSRMPSEGLRLLADRLPPVLNRGRNHDYGLQAGIAVCCNPHTPIDTIERMIADARVSTSFRRMLVRETTRADVLALLLNDRSDVIQKHARERLRTRLSKNQVTANDDVSQA